MKNREIQEISQRTKRNPRDMRVTGHVDLSFHNCDNGIAVKKICNVNLSFIGPIHADDLFEIHFISSEGRLVEHGLLLTSQSPELKTYYTSPKYAQI